MSYSVPRPVHRPALWAALLVAPAALAPADPSQTARAQAPAAPPAARPGAAAGVVTGVVVDSATGAPLPAAQVRLVGLGRGELTHDDGTFTFDDLPPGRYTVAVQRIGYATAEQVVTLAAGGRAALRVPVAPSAARLSPVVVTGNVGEGRERDALRPTRVVGGAELDRRLGETVAATLLSQPGVTISSLGPATARPVIRGLSGDRVLVLEDGIRPGDLSSTSADHAVAVDPLTARQLEVVRGPNSLLYGPSALGGVVNVVRDEVPTSPLEHAHGSATAQAASVNRGATAGGFVTAPLGHVRGGPFGGAHLAGRVEGSARDGGDLRTPLGTLRNTGLRTYGGAAGLALVGERGHGGLSYRTYRNDYGIPGGFVGSHPNGVDVRMRRHTVRAEAERRFAGAAGDGGAGREGRAVLGVPLTSARVTAAYTDYGHRELEASGAVGTRFAQRLGQADLLVRHGATAGLASGAVGARVQLRGVTTGGALRTPSTDDVSAAAFVVEEAQLGGVRLQGGVRYDYARYAPRTRAFVRVGEVNTPTEPRTFGAVSGSLGALVDAGAGVQFGASAARAYRTPDFNELYSDGPHLAAYTYDVGNPRLGQETGLGGDLFVRVTRPRLRAEAAGFVNALSGYVYPRNTGLLGRQGGRPLFQFTGRDARLVGADASAEWAPGPALVVEGTLSYVRGALRGAPDSLPADAALGLPARAGSRDLPLMPPLQGRVGARYERPRWFAGAGVRAAARQERLGDYETPTAGYAVGDLTAGLRLVLGARLHTLTLRVDNVLDQEYRDHLSRVKAVLPEAGRNLSLLYRVAF
jgi:iron complex outermembrane receptor protein